MAERKRIGVPISGLDTSTPDHSVVDGKCETLHNLRYTGEAWRNVKGFKGKNSKASQITYKHPASPENKYIKVESNTIKKDKVKLYQITAYGPNGDIKTCYIDKPLNFENIVGKYLRHENGNVFGYIVSANTEDYSIGYEYTSGPRLLWQVKCQYISNKMYISKQLFLQTDDSYLPKNNSDIFEMKDGRLVYFGKLISFNDNILTFEDIDGNQLTSAIHLESGIRRTPIFPLAATAEEDSLYYYLFPRDIPKEGDIVLQSYRDDGPDGFYMRFYRTVISSTIKRVASHIDPETGATTRPYTLLTLKLGASSNQYGDTENETTLSFKTYNITYSTDVNETLTEVKASPEGNIIDGYETIVEYTVSEIDSTTNAISQDIGKFDHPIQIGHFGNLLIVREPTRLNSQYYLYSNGNYTYYYGDDAIECETSIAIRDYEDSPNIVAIPIPYDAKDSDDDGYIREYNYILAAAEAISAQSNPSSPLLISTHNEYFRGEFAYFAVLRNEEGTEIARSTPKIVRTETITNVQPDIFTFAPKWGDNYNKNYIVWGYSGNIEHIISRQLLDLGEGVWDDSFTYGSLWDATKSSDGVGGKDLRDIINTHMPVIKANNPEQRLYTLTLNLNIDGLINRSDIANIEIYSTRLFPLFNTNSEGITSTNAVDVLKEPFYRMAKLGANERSYNITSESFLNIEQSILYTPYLSMDTLYSDNGFEYNNAYHMYKVNIAAIDKKHLNFEEESSGVASHVMIERRYNNLLYGLIYPATSMFAQEQSYCIVMPTNIKRLVFGDQSSATEILANTILFPNYNTEMDISYVVNSNIGFNSKENKVEGTDAFHKQSTILDALSAALGDFTKYKQVSLLNTEPQIITIGNTFPIIELNRVQVSEPNNILVLPYANSYRIGSATNEIIAINSAAIEMSDSKFGEFPVYVFTKEGIFAMQSGKETLYSAIIPINYDVIINPNTLAVNGAVLYFTDKGLHMLTNQEAKLLSAPINTVENRIPEWMYTTQMVYLPEWNEVLCTDLPNKKAYVFSLDNNVWSTRDIPEGYILNNNELVATDYMIYNLRNEKEQGSNGIRIALSTRPIKLGSMELKRAETIIVRFECNTEQTLNVEVEGSVDTKNWMTLRKLREVKTNKDILIRRTPCSVKYLRFTIDGNVTDDIRILAFEVEYYNRMRHRMR